MAVGMDTDSKQTAWIPGRQVKVTTSLGVFRITCVGGEQYFCLDCPAIWQWSEEGSHPFQALIPRVAYRGATAATGGTGAGVPWGRHLGHGEGGQALGLTLGTVALRFLGPRLAREQDGLGIG